MILKTIRATLILIGFAIVGIAVWLIVVMTKDTPQRLSKEPGEPIVTGTAAVVPELKDSVQSTTTWRIYTDTEYGFSFRYPPQLTLRTIGPSGFAIKRVSLADQLETRVSNLYVTTTSSILQWNAHVNSENTGDCGRQCDRAFSYLTCETSAASCIEDSYEGSFSINFERRAVLVTDGLRLEMLITIPLRSNEMPTSTDTDELVKSGLMSATDADSMNTFNLIFSTLTFQNGSVKNSRQLTLTYFTIQDHSRARY
jgi:hypothetical protein